MSRYGENDRRYNTRGYSNPHNTRIPNWKRELRRAERLERQEKQRHKKEKIIKGIFVAIIPVVIFVGRYELWPYITSKLKGVLQDEPIGQIDQAPIDNIAIPSRESSKLGENEILSDNVVASEDLTNSGPQNGNAEPEIGTPHVTEQTILLDSDAYISAEEFAALLAKNNIKQNPNGSLKIINNGGDNIDNGDNGDVFQEQYGAEYNLEEGEIPEEDRIIFVPAKNVNYLPIETYSYDGPEGLWKPATTKPYGIILHWDGQHWDGNTEDTDDLRAQKTINSFMADTQPGRIRRSANFVVDPDVAIQTTPMGTDSFTRAFGAQRYNIGNINIETTGSYYDEHLPPESQTDNVIALIKDLMKQYNIGINNIYGHFQLDKRADGTDRGKPDPGPGYLAYVKFLIYSDKDFRESNPDLFTDPNLENKLIGEIVENCSPEQIESLSNKFPDLNFNKLDSTENNQSEIIQWGVFPVEIGSISESERVTFAETKYLPSNSYMYGGEYEGNVLRAKPTKIVIHWNGADMTNLRDEDKNNPMVTYNGLLGRTNDKDNPWEVATHFAVAGDNVKQMIPMGVNKIVLGVTSDNHYDTKGNLLPDNQLALTIPAIHIETQGSDFDHKPPVETQTETLVNLTYNLLKYYHLQIKDVAGHNETSPYIHKPDPGERYLNQIRIKLIQKAISENNIEVLGDLSDWKEFYSLKNIDGTIIAIPTDYFVQLMQEVPSD